MVDMKGSEGRLGVRLSLSGGSKQAASNVAVAVVMITVVVQESV